MNVTGEHFLARAGLAVYQNRAVSLAQGFNQGSQPGDADAISNGEVWLSVLATSADRTQFCCHGSVLALFHQGQGQEVPVDDDVAETLPVR